MSLIVPPSCPVAEDAVSTIDLPGVDQGQVAAVLAVLLQAIDPGTTGRSRTVGNPIVEDAELPSASLRTCPGSDHDATHVPTGWSGEQRPGNDRTCRTDTVNACLTQAMDDV